MDIDTKIQLQLVRDRFIDGQAECALGCGKVTVKW